MAITAGARLGPYQILSMLGAGGMGEVWRARDTRLDREVAIKILPADFAADARLKLRFEREARAISSLNHPNICTLHDVGNENGVDYLVMELIDGQSLADRLSNGPLPREQVLRLGAQIATALDAAHKQGVIHRDLKPGNIMLTKSGAKLVDFGLARSAGTLANSATEGMTAKKPITEQGTIVGTFQYMAPEQLEGVESDQRSDIFALGAVLYEMVTGRRAFAGKTRTSVIAAIVSSEPPPISTVQPLTPPELERLIRGCLEKDPDARVQSAHDVAMQLRWIGGAEGEGRPQGWKSNAGWAVAALLAFMLIGGAVYHVRSRPAPAPSLRFTVSPAAGTNVTRTAAISPDGRRIVFRGESLTEGAVLWMRSLDTLATTRLPGTENANVTFFSPDGRHIGFCAGSRLRRFDTADGSIRTLVEGTSTMAGGGTWNRDGVILFPPGSEGPLYRVSAEGGEQVPVTKMEKGEKFHMWPWFLPDGRHFIYSVMGSGDTGGIYAGSLDGKVRKRVVPHGPLPDRSRAIYGAGHLFYLRGTTLVAQEFDLDDLEVRGTAKVIDDDLEMKGPLITPIGVSNDGTLVYRKSGAAVVDQLFISDRSGRNPTPIGKPVTLNTARISSDGKRILLGHDDPVNSVWVRDIERETETRITFESWAGMAAWAGADSIVYSAASDTPPNLFLKRPQGTVLRLTNADRQHYISSVTPDGRFAIYVSEDPKSNSDIFAMPLTPPHTAFALRNSPATETAGQVSPDGRWLAYLSNESGTQQMYVTTFPEPGRVWQISTGRGSTPRWSGDGRELFYRDVAQAMVMSVKIDSSANDLNPGRPTPLFAARELFDVSAKGQFLTGKPEMNASSPPLTVITNWRK